MFPQLCDFSFLSPTLSPGFCFSLTISTLDLNAYKTSALPLRTFAGVVTNLFFPPCVSQSFPAGSSIFCLHDSPHFLCPHHLHVTVMQQHKLYTVTRPVFFFYKFQLIESLWDCGRKLEHPERNPKSWNHHVLSFKMIKGSNNKWGLWTEQVQPFPIWMNCCAEKAKLLF